MLSTWGILRTVEHNRCNRRKVSHFERMRRGEQKKILQKWPRAPLRVEDVMELGITHNDGK